MSRSSLKGSLSVFVHWELAQVSTSHMCKLHIGPMIVFQTACDVTKHEHHEKTHFKEKIKFLQFRRVYSHLWQL